MFITGAAGRSTLSLSPGVTTPHERTIKFNDAASLIALRIMVGARLVQVYLRGHGVWV